MTEYICEPIRDFEWDSGYDMGYIRKAELIRCKDCKHWERGRCEQNDYSKWNADDFCSWAERREE